MKMKLSKRGRRIKERYNIIRGAMEGDMEFENRMLAIQTLIPIGLEKVREELMEEFNKLAGKPYERGKEMGPWGENNGSVFLGDQKVALTYPRVRHKKTNREIPLKKYKRLQDPGVINGIALSRVLNGISHGNYEKAVVSVPETFGIKRGSISKKFIRASANKLRELMERDLSLYDIVAIFIDGKTFAKNNMIMALGITLDGKKVPLGFIEASTENQKVCRDFLRGLVDRGLRTENEILFIIDGGKGIHKGITDVLKEKAVIQRCQWHKRENVLAYLDKEAQAIYRRKLQAAYEQPRYEKAKEKLNQIKRDLENMNISAVNSLEEGLEETLTLHRLGMFSTLGTSFKTTNCIENVNRQLEIKTGRVSYWQNSDQRRRWVGTALLEIEPGLRKVKGYQHLPELRLAMKRLQMKKETGQIQKAA